MLKNLVGSTLWLVALGLVAATHGCAPKTDESGGENVKAGAKAKADVEAQADEAADPSKMMSMPEVVFDPHNPPPGFSKCHRNHCHRVGGGVASYQQVMTEIGATKSINVPKPKPMPPAPTSRRRKAP